MSGKDLHIDHEVGYEVRGECSKGKSFSTVFERKTLIECLFEAQNSQIFDLKSQQLISVDAELHTYRPVLYVDNVTCISMSAG